MEKRALIAIAISFVILLGWTYLFPPPEKEEPPDTVQGETLTEEDSGRRRLDTETPGTSTADRIETGTEPESYEDSPALGAVTVEEVRVTTDYFDLVMSNRGAVLESFRLSEYTNSEDQPLELITHYEEDRPLPLEVDLDDASLAQLINEALFEVQRSTLPAVDDRGEAERLTFVWSDGRGLEVHKELTIRDRDWLIDVKLDVIDRGRRIPARMSVGPGMSARNSGGGGTYYYAGQGVWNQGGNATHFKRRKLLKSDSGFSGNVRWAGLEDQYFASLIVPNDSDVPVRWRSIERTPIEVDGSDDEVEPTTEAIFSVGVPEDGARLFIGPKKYRLLADLGFGLEKAVWFSSNSLLGTIAKYIFFVLIWIYDNVAANYGLAIILSTMLLRVLLFPVNQYSMVKMKKTQVEMQRLQPKLKSIKAKYGKKKDAQSRQKMQQEQMELYKREGINPMGGVAGCLPLLAQFPILIGFYNMLTVTVELRGAPFFGWIQDLAQKDPYWVLPLLMGVTMFAQQKLAMSKVTDPMQQQQQKFMMFMPVVFTWICLQMPAGMVLYWFVNNLLGIAQQWLVNRHAERLQTAAQKA